MTKTIPSRRAILAGLGGLCAAPLLQLASSAAPGDAGNEDWKPLFDGKSLAGWKRTEFAAGGDLRFEKEFRGAPAILLDIGERLSGFQWTGAAPPKSDYEIELEGVKLKGDDFWCGLTFPVGDSHATLVLGGWGGGVTGISSIDNADASENPTTKFLSYPRDRWYRVRLRVTPKKLEAWLDEKPIVELDTTDRKISLRPGDIHMQRPLGIATYQTSAAFRSLRLRSLKK